MIVYISFREVLLKCEPEIMLLKFEALTAMRIKVAVFWELTSSIKARNGDSKLLWNVDKYLRDLMAQRPARESSYKIISQYLFDLQVCQFPDNLKNAD